jgi:pimeloyl-ACP methyl ester carboxylesterase
VLNLVFLPATEPDDDTYGRPPAELAADVEAFEVRFPRMVWYNQKVRREALRQIDAMPVDELVLVGFSKSGLGAWHLARELGGRATATIIFDAPMSRQGVPREWGAGPFYADEEQWQRDLPSRHIEEFVSCVPARHRLVLISGEHFHAEMEPVSVALGNIGHAPTFLARPELRHHWQAGWIELGLETLASGFGQQMTDGVSAPCGR